ncbi:DNA-3-methyladenine glycosylase I [Streptomyces sp. NPDC050625]|uniref:DNA-3-methyladenine glycosylase I n=1 Tax=Streptomyces sp. NPDC050625 TaxID=3154629 RepID=UPI00342117BE
MNRGTPLRRCSWAETVSPEVQRYHDREWGVPLHGERALFELLTLEGAQAGLSWSTVLTRRDGYRRAFAAFDPEVIAAWSDDRVDRLLRDPGIIRHRGKISSALGNARAVLELRNSEGGLDDYVWSFATGPIALTAA